MPVGKSGKHYFNPRVMQSHGDSPEGDGASIAKARTEDEIAKSGDGRGDGLHHHELHEHEEGAYHSVHRHPDGHEEHMEHPHFEHAVKHMRETFGKGSEEKQDERAGGRGDEGENSSLSSLYEQG